MRLAMLTPLLLLAACQVSRDDANDTITAEFNEDVAANVAENTGNAIENFGEAVANEASEAADKIENKVGDVDVDVDVSRNAPANAQ